MFCHLVVFTIIIIIIIIIIIFSIHESVHKSAQQETCNNTTLNSLNSHGPHQFPTQGGINVVQAPRSSPKFL
jgi:Na+/melibiose symporter-like transporter